MYFRNVTGATLLKFIVRASYVGKLADWIEKVKVHLKNTMKDQLLVNYTMNIDSLTVVGAYIFYQFNGT